MTVYVTTLQPRATGSSNYPYIEVSLTGEDARDGVILEIDVAATVGLATSVQVLGLMGDENVETEVAGNTLYDVNAAAAAKKVYGTMTFDFTALKKNRVTLKAGTTVGGVALPAVLPPILGFRFADAGLRIVNARATRRLSRTGG